MVQTLSLKEGTDGRPSQQTACIKLRELEQLSADLIRLTVGLGRVRSLPPIVVINLVRESDLVCPTGISEDLFLYLSATAADSCRKMAHFGVELRK
jgi:hypothetical protein